MATVPKRIPLYVYSDCVNLYAMGASKVTDFMEEMSSTSFIDAIGHAFSDPINNVVSLRLFPFNTLNFGFTTTESYIRVGGTISTKAKGFDLVDNAQLFSVGTFLIPEEEDFTYSAKFSKIFMWVPFVGMVTLDPDLVSGQLVTLWYSVDAVTGRCTAYLTNDILGYTYWSGTGQIGAQVQFGGVNFGETGGEWLSAIRSGLTMLSSGAKSVGAAAGGNMTGKKGFTQQFGKMLDSAGGMIYSTLEAVTTDIHGNTQSDIAMMHQPMTPYMYWIRPEVFTTALYNSVYGRPLWGTRVLSTLSGYTEIAEIHLEGFGSATDDELAEIERLLKSGVILPTQSSE